MISGGIDCLIPMLTIVRPHSLSCINFRFITDRHGSFEASQLITSSELIETVLIWCPGTSTSTFCLSLMEEIFYFPAITIFLIFWNKSFGCELWLDLQNPQILMRIFISFSRRHGGACQRLGRKDRNKACPMLRARAKPPTKFWAHLNLVIYLYRARPHFLGRDISFRSRCVARIEGSWESCSRNDFTGLWNHAICFAGPKNNNVPANDFLGSYGLPYRFPRLILLVPGRFYGPMIDFVGSQDRFCWSPQLIFRAAETLFLRLSLLFARTIILQLILQVKLTKFEQSILWVVRTMFHRSILRIGGTIYPRSILCVRRTLIPRPTLVSRLLLFPRLWIGSTDVVALTPLFEPATCFGVALGSRK